MSFDYSAFLHKRDSVVNDQEDFEDLKRARFALMNDAELSLCNGLTKEEWKRSSYVKSTRDKIWWLEDEDIHFIAEYVWEHYSDYFEEEETLESNP